MDNRGEAWGVETVENELSEIIKAIAELVFYRMGIGHIPVGFDGDAIVYDMGVEYMPENKEISRLKLRICKEKH